MIKLLMKDTMSQKISRTAETTGNKTLSNNKTT